MGLLRRRDVSELALPDFIRRRKPAMSWAERVLCYVDCEGRFADGWRSGYRKVISEHAFADRRALFGISNSGCCLEVLHIIAESRNRYLKETQAW